MPGTPGFLSLMDKVLPDDPLLDGISQEERDIILGEEMTYYDTGGCQQLLIVDTITNPIFLKNFFMCKKISLCVKKFLYV